MDIQTDASNVPVVNSENKVGRFEYGYTITVGKAGIIPTNTQVMLNRVSKLHARLKNAGPINTDEDGIKRNEDVKLLNGARDELDRHEKMLVGPLDEIKGKIVDTIRPYKLENAQVTSTTKETIVDWSNRTRRRLEKERIEKNEELKKKQARLKLERDEQIRIANEKAAAIEAKRLLEVEARQMAEKEKSDKEKLQQEIEIKIEETLEKKDELGKEIVNKELGDLAQQKNIIDEEIKTIDVKILKKRDSIRLSKEKELIIKGDIQMLEREPLAVVEPEIITDLIPKVVGVNIATYDKWEVEDIDELPDEWVIITKIANKEKINEVFKKYPNMQIKGIRRYKEQIVRAIAHCPRGR